MVLNLLVVCLVDDLFVGTDELVAAPLFDMSTISLQMPWISLSSKLLAGRRFLSKVSILNDRLWSKTYLNSVIDETFELYQLIYELEKTQTHSD